MSSLQQHYQNRFRTLSRDSSGVYPSEGSTTSSVSTGAGGYSRHPNLPGTTYNGNHNSELPPKNSSNDINNDDSSSISSSDNIEDCIFDKPTTATTLVLSSQSKRNSNSTTYDPFAENSVTTSGGGRRRSHRPRGCRGGRKNRKKRLNAAAAAAAAVLPYGATSSVPKDDVIGSCSTFSVGARASELDTTPLSPNENSNRHHHPIPQASFTVPAVATKAAALSSSDTSVNPNTWFDHQKTNSSQQQDNGSHYRLQVTSAAVVVESALALRPSNLHHNIYHPPPTSSATARYSVSAGLSNAAPGSKHQETMPTTTVCSSSWSSSPFLFRPVQHAETLMRKACAAAAAAAAGCAVTSSTSATATTTGTDHHSPWLTTTSRTARGDDILPPLPSMERDSPIAMILDGPNPYALTTTGASNTEKEDDSKGVELTALPSLRDHSRSHEHTRPQPPVAVRPPPIVKKNDVQQPQQPPKEDYHTSSYHCFSSLLREPGSFSSTLSHVYRNHRIEKQRQVTMDSLFATSPRSFLLGTSTSDDGATRTGSSSSSGSSCSTTIPDEFFGMGSSSSNSW